MKSISKIDEKTIKNYIKQELRKLNYNFNFIGTQYIIDAIYLLYSLKTYYKFSLEKDIYPAIANKYCDTANTIKGAIVYATDKMFYDCNEEVLQNYLYEFIIFDEEDTLLKPGPKMIIRAVLKRIKDK